MNKRKDILLMQNRNDIRVLLTDVNHPVTPSVTKILKANNEYNIFIVGVDTSKQTFGALWTDKFYLVSDPTSDQYYLDILSIAKQERIDVIIPWTNIEALALSKHAQIFKENNIKVICNSYQTTHTLVDKGTAYESLKHTTIPVPEYSLVSTIEEVKKAVYALGYPNKQVILKPRNYSGGRGIYLIGTHANLIGGLTSKQIPLEAFIAILNAVPEDKKKKLDYIAMEYLTGEDFSVDTFSELGKPLWIVQRKRIADIGGVSSIAETVDNSQVRNLAEDIIKHFSINYNCNLQFRYRNNMTGQPYIYDINPRISGTIIANFYAGIDLLTLSIYKTMGIAIDYSRFTSYKKIRVIRYWSEWIENLEDSFPS